MDYRTKYLKYKTKYLQLKTELEGGTVENEKSIPDSKGHKPSYVNLENKSLFGPTLKFIYLDKKVYDDNDTDYDYFLAVTTNGERFHNYKISNKNSIIKDYQIKLLINENSDVKGENQNEEDGPGKPIDKIYYGLYTFSTSYPEIISTKNNTVHTRYYINEHKPIGRLDEEEKNLFKVLFTKKN